MDRIRTDTQMLERVVEYHPKDAATQYLVSRRHQLGMARRLKTDGNHTGSPIKLKHLITYLISQVIIIPSKCIWPDLDNSV